MRVATVSLWYNSVNEWAFNNKFSLIFWSYIEHVISWLNLRYKAYKMNEIKSLLLVVHIFHVLLNILARKGSLEISQIMNNNNDIWNWHWRYRMKGRVGSLGVNTDMLCNTNSFCNILPHKRRLFWIVNHFAKGSKHQKVIA